jgi:interferon-induced transmembrane protein/zinc ribbon protein
MYCTHCGTERADGATVCGKCGQRVAFVPPATEVPTYLVHSILVTLCCCLPLGVVAVIYAAQVNSKLAVGDVAGAQVASRRARTWVIVTFTLGIVSLGLLAGVSYFSR